MKRKLGDVTVNGGKMARLDFVQAPYDGRLACVYVRVSSNDLKRVNRKDKVRRLRESVQTQESDGVAMAKARGWEYQVFRNDCNLSGFEEEGRADLQTILAMCRAGRVHTIVCRDPYRISRNASLTSDILWKTLIPNGVNVLCLDMPDLSIATSEGQEAFVNYGLRGQSQLRYIAKTSMRNKQQLVEAGGFAAKPPYGWRIAGRERNAVEQVPEQVDVVKWVFAEYDSGRSLSSVVEEMQSRGFVRSVAGNTDWSIGDVGRLLRRCQYVGRVPFNGKEYASPYEPIVSDEVWDRVQARLRKNETRAQREKGSLWLASGLVRCGHCEDRKKAGQEVRWTHLHVTSVSSSSSDEYVKVYQCGVKHRYGRTVCSGTSIRVDVIDEFLRAFVGQFSVCKIATAPSTSAIQAELNKAEASVETLRNRKASLLSQFATAGGSVEDLAAVTKKLNADISAAERAAEAARVRLAAVDRGDAREALDALSKWDSLEISTKRELLRKVIDRIVVYPDRIVVYTAINPNAGITFALVKVGMGGKRMIKASDLDAAAMSVQLAVDFSTEREEVA